MNYTGAVKYAQNKSGRPIEVLDFYSDNKRVSCLLYKKEGYPEHHGLVFVDDMLIEEREYKPLSWSDGFSYTAYGLFMKIVMGGTNND